MSMTGNSPKSEVLRGIALALPVQRLMLTELLEQNHRQQARAGEAAQDDVERRGGLRDRFAVPAREALTHGLDHFPLARDNLQRLGDVLAELRQLQRAAARTGGRRGDHDALARQMRGERFSRRPAAREGRDLARRR